MSQLKPPVVENAMPQLMIDLRDLIPTETLELCEALPQWDRWYDSIETIGILHCLKVHPNRRIADGNARYWIARILGIIYIPIDAHFYFGIWRSESALHIREEFMNMIDLDLLRPITIRAPNTTHYPVKDVVNEERTVVIKNARRIILRGEQH